MEKMTYKMALNYVLENCATPADVKEKLENLLESLNKKSTSSSDKPSKREKENMPLLEEAYKAMTYENQTVSDLIKFVPAFKDLSNQKVSYLANALVKEGKIIKENIKGKTYFRLK